MLLSNITNYRLVLGSQSPRRQSLLAGFELPFEVRVLPDIDESYPDTVKPEDVAEYVACKKAECYLPQLADDELLITADTIVWNFDEIMGKPEDREDAIRMLQRLSGHVHEVITGVCLSTHEKTASFSTSSAVCFAEISDEEIIYYVDKYLPFDKAGAYGIQDWIGYIGIEAINGSFYNVMGLPMQRLYQALKAF